MLIPKLLNILEYLIEYLIALLIPLLGKLFNAHYSIVVIT